LSDIRRSFFLLFSSYSCCCFLFSSNTATLRKTAQSQAFYFFLSTDLSRSRRYLVRGPPFHFDPPIARLPLISFNRSFRSARLFLSPPRLCWLPEKPQFPLSRSPLLVTSVLHRSKFFRGGQSTDHFLRSPAPFLSRGLFRSLPSFNLRKAFPTRRPFWFVRARFGVPSPLTPYRPNLSGPFRNILLPSLLNAAFHLNHHSNAYRTFPRTTA